MRESKTPFGPVLPLALATLILALGCGASAPTPPLQSPADVRCDAYDQAVLVTWNAVPDAVSYNVYRSTDSTTWERINTEAVEQTRYGDGSLDNGTTYYYYVTAVDSSGREGLGNYETSGGSATPEEGACPC